MKRLLLALAVAASLTACGSTSNEFFIKDGVCYRTRTEKTIGIQTYQQTTAALPANCGL